MRTKACCTTCVRGASKLQDKTAITERRENNGEKDFRGQRGKVDGCTDSSTNLKGLGLVALSLKTTHPSNRLRILQQR